MQIHQLVIRPQDNTVIMLYLDSLDRRFSEVFEMSTMSSAAALVAECQTRLPSDANHPAKGEIQKEIADLESRLAQLKDAIGVP